MRCICDNLSVKGQWISGVTIQGSHLRQFCPGGRSIKWEAERNHATKTHRTLLLTTTRGRSLEQSSRVARHAHRLVRVCGVVGHRGRAVLVADPRCRSTTCSRWNHCVATSVLSPSTGSPVLQPAQWTPGGRATSSGPERSHSRWSRRVARTPWSTRTSQYHHRHVNKYTLTTTA